MKLIPLNELQRKFLQDKVGNMPVDGTFVVEIKAVVQKRSVNQNKMYWAWLKYISEKCDGVRTHADYYHGYFKSEYLPRVTENIFGKDVRCYKSTTLLTKEEFSEYLDKIEALMLKIGYELPRLLGHKYDKLMEIYG